MEGFKNQYVKRTQKDYSLPLKLSVVSEIEHGEIPVTSAQKKYGIQGNATIIRWLGKFGTFPLKIPPPLKPQEQIRCKYQ
jgi:hypothetical protein